MDPKLLEELFQKALAPIVADVAEMKRAKAASTPGAGVLGAAPNAPAVPGIDPTTPWSEQKQAIREAAYRSGIDPHEGRGLGFARIVRAIHEIRNSTDRGVTQERLASSLKRIGALAEEKSVRAMEASSFGDGGSFIPEMYSTDFINVLRAEAIFLSLNPVVVPLNEKGNMTFPSNTAASTGYWIGEGEAITKSQPSTGQVKLSAKKAGGLIPVSNDLLRYGGALVDQMLRDDLVKTIRLLADLAYIRGSGSSAQPRGVRYAVDQTNNVITAVNSLSPSLTQVDADLDKLDAALDDADVPEIRRGYMMNGRTKRYIRSLRDGLGGYPYRAEIDAGMLRGRPLRTTTQIPKNLGSGTNESELYLVEFTEAMAGIANDVRLDFDPNGTWVESGTTQSGFATDTSVMRAIVETDFQLRHNKGAAVLTAVKWGSPT